MSNFQNPKVPPTGGSHLPNAHPSSEMRRTVPVPTRGAGDGRQIYANLARSRGTGRVKARCIGRCAGCSCGRDSAARLEYRAVVGKFIAARMPQHVRIARSRPLSRRPPPHPFREPRNPGRIDCTGAPLARRTHCRPPLRILKALLDVRAAVYGRST
jgi:hypothetical protein